MSTMKSKEYYQQKLSEAKADLVRSEAWLNNVKTMGCYAINLIKTARAEGWDAAYYGKPDENPYPLGSARALVWAEAYKESAIHHENAVSWEGDLKLDFKRRNITEYEANIAHIEEQERKQKEAAAKHAIQGWFNSFLKKPDHHG